MKTAKLFTSPTCIPCRQLKAKLAADAALKDKIELIDISTDAGAVEAQKYGVFSVPVIIFFTDGQPVNQLSGPVHVHIIKEMLA